MKWLDQTKARYLSSPVVTKRLREVESAILGKNTVVPGVTYYILGRYFVRREFLRKFARSFSFSQMDCAPWLFSAPHKIKAFFIRLGIPLIWLTGGAFGRLRFDFREVSITPDVILVKRNLRLFYMDAGVTAKIPKRESPAKIVTEIRVRKSVLEPQSIFQVPRIQSHGSQMDWYVEPLLSGRVSNERDCSLLMTKLFPDLVRHYENNFRGFTSCSKIPLGEQLSRARSSENAGFVDEWLERDVLISFCHGDLELHNIFITEENGVVPIDWDSAGDGPVVADVASLALLNLESTGFWDRWLLAKSLSGRPLLVQDMARIRRLLSQ